jgi:hypothetical protein
MVGVPHEIGDMEVGAAPLPVSAVTRSGNAGGDFWLDAAVQPWRSI